MARKRKPPKVTTAVAGPEPDGWQPRQVGTPSDDVRRGLALLLAGGRDTRDALRAKVVEAVARVVADKGRCPTDDRVRFICRAVAELKRESQLRAIAAALLLVETCGGLLDRMHDDVQLGAVLDEPGMVVAVMRKAVEMAEERATATGA